MSVVKDDAWYSSRDKRTKEYKEWAALKKKQLEEPTIKGVGDVVEKVTEFTGIKSAVNNWFGEDCGCDERKDSLNELLPFGVTAVNCVDEDDYHYLRQFFARRRTRIDAEQQQRMVDIYNHVYDKKMVSPSSCQGCPKTGFIKAINKLKMYFESTQTQIKSTSDSNEEE